MLTFSYLSFFDLFIRFATFGQLALLALYFGQRQKGLIAPLSVLFCFTLSSYLLLTAPIANEEYGILRGMFLLLTEILPYSLWALAFVIIRDDFRAEDIPKGIKVIALLTLAWFGYFFGYLQGRGSFHQVNHAIQMLFLIHVIYLALGDLHDDLEDNRRKFRLLLVLFACFYLTSIILLELMRSTLRDNAIFSIINAASITISVTIVSWYCFKQSTPKAALATPCEEVTETATSEVAVPLNFQHKYQELCQLMTDDFFTQSDLTVKTLADKLTMPEHQLRELINRHLGFKNFSVFLNSYRIPAACEIFQDMAQIRTPILTIALNLGFGSIGPFNRAFKQMMGQTPSEYRKKFQKQ